MSAVASGKEALALLRTKAHLKEYFDVVLLDQDMPGMTGMQLASKIKEDSSLNHDILLIMLTGMSSAPSKIIARNAGIKRILAKPVAGYTLKTTLADELAQRQAGSQHRPSPTAQPLPPLEVPSDFRILVAEDNSISTKVIRGMLNKLNLQPDTACNGEEALEAIKAQPYDLVLMDCEMPVLDGFRPRTSCANGRRTMPGRVPGGRAHRAYTQRAPRTCSRGRHGRSHGQAGGAVPSARADRPLGSRQAGRARRMMTCRRLRIRTPAASHR